MIQRKIYNPIAAVIYAICVLAMIWPGAMLANRIEPFVFGLPFMFFWYVAWVFVLFVGLTALYWIEKTGGA